MIPYLYDQTADCGQCGETFHYDASIAKRKPRTCPTCKTSGIARRELARREALKAAVASIDGRELEKLAVRTHESVGDEMGISAEQVRKLERSALAKLRKILQKSNDQISNEQIHNS